MRSLQDWNYPIISDLFSFLQGLFRPKAKQESEVNYQPEGARCDCDECRQKENMHARISPEERLWALFIFI